MPPPGSIFVAGLSEKEVIDLVWPYEVSIVNSSIVLQGRQYVKCLYDEDNQTNTTFLNPSLHLGSVPLLCPGLPRGGMKASRVQVESSLLFPYILHSKLVQRFSRVNHEDPRLKVV